MKRNKTITAKDSGGTKVSITIKIDTRFGLMRDEVATMTDELTSGIMRAMTDVRYLHVPLCDIKVR